MSGDNNISDSGITEFCDVFDLVDILLLRLLADIEIATKKNDCLDLLIKILSNSNLIYLNAETRNILLSIFSSVSILLGRLKRVEESIEI